MKYSLFIGRVLFSLIFLMTVMSHFSAHTVDYASQKGVPMANWLVPIAGILAIAGGLSIVVGYKAKAGALLVVIFLIPVTFFMHAFWKETEPMLQQMQMVNFMKNLSMLGAALIINYFGSGPLSLDNYFNSPDKVVVKGFNKDGK